MNRFLVLIIVVAAAGSSCAAAEKPDVLVILSDQWSPRYLSWDNPQVRTPNLDRIAHEGMIFDACYTPAPICMPARVSLISGLYPHDHGHALWTNTLHYCVAPDAAPMFRDIRQAGYTTAQIGKTHWTGGDDWKKSYQTQDEYFAALGLDHVDDISGPVDSPRDRGLYAQHLRQRGLLETVAADLHNRYIQGEFLARASVVRPDDYHDSVVTRLATEFIRQQPHEKPICLVVSLHSPHPPLDAPGEFATMYDPQQLTLPDNVPASMKYDGRTLDHAEVKKVLANYLGKTALVDHCVGQLVEAMKARGTWDRALVVFTSDHGEMMGAHAAFTKGRFYEESARVPLVIRWPGQIPANRSQALVQMFDVYPTIVEAVGGKISAGRFAKSLLPVATGKAPAVRDLVISEVGNAAPLKIMARDARFKYWAEGEAERLFDLEKDPLEMHDLANLPEYRDALDQMRRRLLTYLRSTLVNFGDGYKGKVKTMREAEGAKDGARLKRKTK